MVNLIIDIGNTFTKIAVFNNRTLVFDSIKENISQQYILKLITEKEVTHSIISSVNKEDYEVCNTLRSKTHHLTFTGTTGSKITNKYKTPQTLGADRLAGIIGAHYLYPKKETLVIDAGTCITIDLVDKEGNYWGGSISPGLAMRLKAMHTFTSKLPLVKLDKEFNDYTGTDTETCLLAGGLYGAYLETIGFINNFKKKYKELQILLCGGDASFFDTKLKNSIFAPIVKSEPHLVLIGLNEVIHHHND